MNGWKTLRNGKIEEIIGHCFLLCTFAILDAWLRVQTRWIGAYSIYELAPNLFTLLWSLGLVSCITSIPSRKTGKFVYAVVYYLAMLYATVQYGAYLVLGKFLYASDFLLAGEGADYASWVLDLLTPSFLLQILVLAALGVLGLHLYPVSSWKLINARKRVLTHMLVSVSCVIGLLFVPRLYGESPENQWDSFSSPAFEYKQFTNANFDMELTGIYQFLARDIRIQLGRGANREEQILQVNAFFEKKAEHTDNDMTGLFEGKNVIVVMMETMDDWTVTKEDTPTLYRMITEGIQFTDFYTPQYSNGYTFNTEFAFNVSAYPYSNGNVAYSLLRNCFDYSLANQFAAEGYYVNSYHAGAPTFYNREQMHTAWGYQKYHSYQDYPEEHVHYLDDRFLVESDGLYNDLISKAPFFSFVITYSPHLPFTDEDEVAKTALDVYPEYDVRENREEAILRAKARLTDDMFAGLLVRLEADGLLEDTVIIGFSDHYAYGLSDRDRLQQLSEEAGNSILENTPAFIYCAGSDLSLEVDKVMQITDLAPTVMNLFGLKVPKEIMGRDIFDETYEGYVVFADRSWLTKTTYVKNGAIVWNHGMTEEEIRLMNGYVQEVYQVNDAILDSDYYAHMGK